MNASVKTPAITQIIKDGYMPSMLRTVIEALRWKATSMKFDGLISDKQSLIYKLHILTQKTTVMDSEGLSSIMVVLCF